MRRNKVWDRHALNSSIHEIIAEEGRFVCLLGGKSTGKTLLLNDVADANKEKVYYTHLRLNNNIYESVFTLLRDRFGRRKYNFISSLLSKVVDYTMQFKTGDAL